MSDLNVYTTSQINALTPITGDMVVDSDLNAVKLYDGAAWRVFNSDSVTGGFQNRWGASFDGSDYLDTGTNLSSTLQSDYTISTWFKRNETVTEYKRFYGHDYRVGSKNIITSYFNATRITFDLNVADSRVLSYFNHTPDTNWHNFVVSVSQDGTSVRVKTYFDGVYKTNLSTNGLLSNYNNPINFIIGATNEAPGPFGYLNAKLDEFAIFGSALSDGGVSIGANASGDIGSIYNGGVPTDLTLAASYDTANQEQNLAGYWRMGDDSNDSPVDAGLISGITDSSGNGNDATTVASSQPTFSALASSETIYV